MIDNERLMWLAGLILKRMDCSFYVTRAVIGDDHDGNFRIHFMSLHYNTQIQEFDGYARALV